LLAGAPVFGEQLEQIHAALAAKDSATLQELTRAFPPPQRQGLMQLVQLYGSVDVLFEAEKCLMPAQNIRSVLLNLKRLADLLQAALPDVRVSVDLADARGYAYYTGARFAIYSPSAGDALARGGRYDEVGSVFGRNRPAVGFSLDIKDLVAAAPERHLQSAIRAPWGDSAALRSSVARLRSAGEVVVCVLPGHESEVQEFHCDRELIEVGGQWVVKLL
jgi:ATP phosphoribosyltransferase regulatory subunit